MFDCPCRLRADLRFILIPFLSLAMLVVLVGCETAPKTEGTQAQKQRDAEEYRKLLDTLRQSKPEASATPDPSDPSAVVEAPAAVKPPPTQNKTPVKWDPAVGAAQANSAQASQIPQASKASAETQTPPLKPSVIDRPVTTNPAPVQTIESVPADQQQLIKELSLAMRNMPADQGLRPYVRRAALSLFDPRLSLKPNELNALNDSQRKAVLAYQRIFTQLGQRLGEAHATDRDQLLIAAGELKDELHLAEAAKLSIRTVKLCRSVTGFGQYETLEPTFVHGAVNRVILYAEVENYQSTVTKDQWFEVRLTQQVELFKINDPAAPVLSIRAQRVVDRSRAKRKDFMTVQSVPLPSSLGVGRYNLKVRITDQGGQYVDEAIVPIRITAESHLASDGK